MVHISTFLFTYLVLVLLIVATTGLISKNPQQKRTINNSAFNHHHKFQQRQGMNSKWDVDVPDEFGERIESVKAAVIGCGGGIIALLPYGFLKGVAFRFSARWEFEFDVWVLGLALFAITYRYAVRKDNNPNLKQGVVGSFAITRALSSIDVRDDLCTSIPINCGAPFYLFSESMLFQGVAAFAESIIAYGGAAYVLERCMSSGLLSKFPKDE